MGEFPMPYLNVSVWFSKSCNLEKYLKSTFLPHPATTTCLPSWVVSYVEKVVWRFIQIAEQCVKGKSRIPGWGGRSDALFLKTRLPSEIWRRSISKLRLELQHVLSGCSLFLSLHLSLSSPYLLGGMGGFQFVYVLKKAFPTRYQLKEKQCTLHPIICVAWVKYSWPDI